jgi:DNA-binding transcriptional regulator YdaS (Cro superfamily)
MDLKTYCHRDGSRTKAIAEACGVSPQAVRHWANGTRKPPCDREQVERIEAVTNYQVTRHDLRPDVFGEAPAEAA